MELISHERAALADFLGSKKYGAIADYIHRTPRIQQELIDFNEATDIATLVQNLRSHGEARRKARDFLDDYLEVNAGRMPISNMPMSARLASSRAEARDNYALGKHRLVHGSVTFALVDFTAATLSAIGLTQRERKLAFALLTTSAIAGLAGQAQAGISPDHTNSRINDFNHSAYSETAEPLQITIEGGQIVMDSDYLLSPFLVQKMNSDPMAQQYVAWMFDAADKNGIDPVLFANQLFRESMHFKYKVVYGPEKSPAGAMGIGQFMESTGPDYGLDTVEDYYNPQKAIYAAARMMSDLSAEYDNDQILALAAYNGGRGAVDFAEEKLGSNLITGEQWVDLMAERNELLGTEGRGSAWDVETLNYITDITGQDWAVDYRQWAVKLQGDNPIQYVQNLLSENPAVAAANSMALTPNG